MQICPTYEYERKAISEWTPFDYIQALMNYGDSLEREQRFESASDISKFVSYLLRLRREELEKEPASH